MSTRLRQFVQDEWLQLFIVALCLLAALVAMPFATEHVPMQWNLRGQVNWYAPKEWGLLVLPLAMVFTYGILFWREALDRGRIDSEERRLTSHGKATRAIRLIMSFMVLILSLVQIASALGRHPDMGNFAPAAGPFILACVGNFFGKLKPNRYMGIRVPWTLKSETVWRKTHRVTGWLYTITGLIAGVLCLLLPTTYTTEVIVAWLALIIVVPLAVAWQAAREERTAQTTTAGLSLGWMALVEAVALMGIIVLYFQNVAADPRHATQRKAAQVAAERWLINLDQSRYEDAWKATGAYFRKVVPQAAQVKALTKYRKPAGATLSRKLYDSRYTETLPDAPGPHVVVQFATTFERLPTIEGHAMEGIETVVEQQEPDGQWQVSGYFIK